MSSDHPQTDVTPFVVLFEGRSGSTFLIESLDSHPQICAEKEFLSTLRKRITTGKEAPNAQLDWVRKFLTTKSIDGCGAVGFKTKLKDVLNPEGLAKQLREIGARIILLHRRNRIKLLVSLMNAIRLNDSTGDWNLYREEDRGAPLTVDVKEFQEWLESLERHHGQLVAYVNRLQLPTLSIHYEDLLVEGRDTLEQVCDFLQVPSQTLSWNTKKNTSDNLREVILNFDELRSKFVGTAYEGMFDEVLV